MKVSDFKDNLTGMLHGGTLNKVRNFEGVMRRAASAMLSRIDPIETIRTATLGALLSGSSYDRNLPDDYKKLIDLYPTTGTRNSGDESDRQPARLFDLRKGISDRKISIEAKDAHKIVRIKWSSSTSFDVKYYSKFLLIDTNGAWIEQTTSDDDELVLDEDTSYFYMLETLILAAHQSEGSDSGFDISFAKKELLGENLMDRTGLYAKYRREHPSQAIKLINSYGNADPMRGRR